MKQAFFIFSLLLLLGISFWGSYALFISKQETTALPVKPTVIPEAAVSAAPFSVAEAPVQSLRAIVQQQTGTVKFISREATEAAMLTTDTIQQGESILTGADGTVSIQFPASESAALSVNSQVNVVQTLPNKVVLEHVNGSGQYSGTFSIRVKRLLLMLQQAVLTITYDDKKDLVYLSVHNGSVTAAYNDAKFVSQVQEISAGHTAVFNNIKRKLTVK